jgi:hypothetical protein
MLMSRSDSSGHPSTGRTSGVPVGVVVSLLTDSASWVHHRDLADNMGLQNNLLCLGKVIRCDKMICDLIQCDMMWCDMT